MIHLWPSPSIRDLCKTPPFEVCAYLANLDVRLKFQSSKYLIYSCGWNSRLPWSWLKLNIFQRSLWMARRIGHEFGIPDFFLVNMYGYAIIDHWRSYLAKICKKRQDKMNNVNILPLRSLRTLREIWFFQQVCEDNLSHCGILYIWDTWVKGLPAVIPGLTVRGRSCIQYENKTHKKPVHIKEEKGCQI